MSLFSNMTTDGLEESKDTLGSTFEALASGAYSANITLAYVGGTDKSKAQNITIHAKIDGKDYRETVWITNREGNNYYIPKDAKDGKITKHPLPGFTTIDDLCLLTTGSPLAEQATETKVVKLYDFDERKEVPKEVQVLSNVMGKDVMLGIIRQIVNKQKRGDDGKYHDTEETRTENVIDKVFHAETGRTVNEYRHEVETAEFLSAWKERNDGKDRNRVKKTVGGNSGASGTGRPGQSATKKLFGN